MTVYRSGVRTYQTRLLDALKVDTPATVRELSTETGIAAENIRTTLRALANRGEVVCTGSKPREPGVAGGPTKTWRRVT
jgi:predicted ArsR family transcriptional regulator